MGEWFEEKGWDLEGEKDICVLFIPFLVTKNLPSYSHQFPPPKTHNFTRVSCDRVWERIGVELNGILESFYPIG